MAERDDDDRDWLEELGKKEGHKGRAVRRALQEGKYPEADRWFPGFSKEGIEGYAMREAGRDWARKGKSDRLKRKHSR
jgi:hypothetical protein